MACREDHLLRREDIARHYGDIKRAVTLLFDICHTRVEMILSAMLYDALSDILDYDRKLVAADMRMRLDKD